MVEHGFSYYSVGRPAAVMEDATEVQRLALEQYRTAMNGTPSRDFNDIVTELENARSQLASTSLGLEYLIKEVNAVKKEAESAGQISELTLPACAGLENEIATICRRLNRINVIESARAAERAQTGQRGGIGQTKGVEPEKNRGVQSAGQSETGEWNQADGGFVLVSAIEMVARELNLRKKVLEGIEKLGDKTRVAARGFAH
jgi:hypothetical protein